MTPELPSISQTALQKLLARKAAERELQEKEFPLSALLALYLAASNTLQYPHFEGFKLLVKWLGPIEKSKREPSYVPRCLVTYECQEIATILGESPYVIYQELTELWTRTQQPR